MNEFEDYRVIYIDDDYIAFTNDKIIVIYNINNGNRNAFNVSNTFNIVRNKNQLVIQTYKNDFYIIKLDVLNITKLPKPISIPVLDYALIANEQNILTYSMNNVLLYKYCNNNWGKYNVSKGHITSIVSYKENKVLIKYINEKPSCELVLVDLNNGDIKVIKQMNCFHFYYYNDIFIELDTPMELSVYLNDDFINPIRNICFDRGDTITNICVRHKIIYFLVRKCNRIKLMEYDFINNKEHILIRGEDVLDINYSYGSGNLFISYSNNSKMMLAHFKISYEELKKGKYKIFKQNSSNKIYLSEVDD